MYKINAIFTFIFFVFTSFNLSAEISYLKCTQEEKLSTLPANELSKIQNAYAALKKFKVNFDQSSYLAALDYSEASSGEIIFKQPGNMRWIYKKPEEQEFLIKDKNFYFYQKEDEQVLVQDLDDVLSTDAPIAFLFGIGNLNSDFKFNRACKLNSEQYVFVLSPKVRAEVASFNELIIKNNRNNLPEIIQVHHIGGNITSVKLENYQEDIDLTDNDFILDVPKGVDIIDKRRDN